VLDDASDVKAAVPLETVAEVPALEGLKPAKP
jgi:hypothetical protein